jgi:hypothetical protein
MRSVYELDISAKDDIMQCKKTKRQRSDGESPAHAPDAQTHSQRQPDAGHIRTDVSDSHAVAPHAVSPIDTRAVPSASPACTPCTVTHDEPVPGMLAWRSELRSGTDPDRRSEAELTLKAEVSRAEEVAMLLDNSHQLLGG